MTSSRINPNDKGLLGHERFTSQREIACRLLISRAAVGLMISKGELRPHCTPFSSWLPTTELNRIRARRVMEISRMFAAMAPAERAKAINLATLKLSTGAAVTDAEINAVFSA